MEKRISRKLKGKVLDSCVVPASTYALAMSELHQHKLQVCESNWIRRIAGVRRFEIRKMKNLLRVELRRVERRKMKDLREEVGNKAISCQVFDQSQPRVGLGWQQRK